MTTEQRIADLERKLQTMEFSNPSHALRTPFIHMDSSLSHSLMRGGLNPVLSDFNDVTTGEFQAQAKAQLALSIVPDGNPVNGAALFGLSSAVNLGVYTCGLLSQGVNSLPSPHMILAVAGGGSANSVITMFNSATLYPVVLGSGAVPAFTGSATLQVVGDTQRLWTARRTPANSAAAGNLGEICFDDNFIYINTSAGWKRVAIAAF